MKNILIVDDDRDLRHYLKRVLSQNGYRPWPTKDGRAALNVIQEQPIDLILSDVAMPQINGYELFYILRESEDARLATIPFVFVSGRTLDSDIRYAKAMGVDDYLTKPVAIEDLLAVVRGKLLAAERLRQTILPGSTGPLPSERLTLRVNEQLLYLDYLQHRAWSEQDEFELTATEIFLLEQLAARPNQIVCLLNLYAATHGQRTTDRQEAGRLLRPVVKTLRAKLRPHFGACIKNVRGRGYMLVGARVANKAD